MRRAFVLLLLSVCCLQAAAAETNLVTNGRFVEGLKGWSALWTRQPGAGACSLEKEGGTNAVCIKHTGSNDWSFEWTEPFEVKPSEVYHLEALARVEGEGAVMLCASTWDREGRNLSWSEGERSLHKSPGWTRLRTRFAISPDVARVHLRLIGSGPATIRVTDVSMVRKPMRTQAGQGSCAVSNEDLAVTYYASNGTFSVLDNRTHRLWTQIPTHPNVIVTSAKAEKKRIELKLYDVTSDLELAGTLELEASRPEFVFTVAGTGGLPSGLAYPFPFATQAGDRLVIPMNEGISYPVEDQTIEPFTLIAYGGHGICMAFWGVTDGSQGQSAIIETADDASIRMTRKNKLLMVAPHWDSQKGSFGYARRLRYTFFDKGGHVAIAKRYREYAKEHGLFKTLEQKRQENPNVDLLVGAVNVWNWDVDPVALVKEMQAAGIERILWSRGGSPEALTGLNDLNALTSRYDIYQDVMDPANFASVGWTHGDWTTSAWPNDIIRTASGDWLRGWGVEGKKPGEWFYCGVICDKRAPEYARERISADLAKHSYKCRFIDTTTAAPWNECYDERHPMTRTESREWKMKLLDVVSHDMKMVTGCETGHDASVPFLHYFEGMLSLGPYRVPDAGRNMEKIWANVPEEVSKFQLGQRYRLPLWELVYHDCVVAQWYWGDYNNKLPALWDKRDLFNLLYGTPPMFMFNKALWKNQRERFVRSYKNTCPYVRAVGYSEMTDHRILTPDRDVQQSVFANGVVITVNFGEKAFTLPGGETVAPMGFQVKGTPQP